MHRDLRWADVARKSKEIYFLLDLELCGKPGKPAFGKLDTWPDDIMADGTCYTEAPDVRALGKMLQDLDVTSEGGRSLKVGTSADGQSCLADMCNAESEQPEPPADKVLKHKWLHCIPSCTLKIFT